MDVLQEAKLTPDGPFNRLEWFKNITQLDVNNDLFLCVASGGEAISALPLRKSHGRLDSFINWYAFIWRPLASDTEASLSLLQALAQNLRKRVSRIVLSPLPDEDNTATMLEQAFRTAGWFVQRQACDINHVLRINGRSYAAYLAERPGTLRTTLARKGKRVNVSICNEFQQDMWDTYEDIYANSWKPSEGNPAFLKQFAQTESAAGRLRLGIAHHDNRPVAAQFWTVENGTAYIHKLAHRADAQKLSPGTTLTAALMEHVIDNDRVELVDFGTGDDTYKSDWMEEVRLRFRLDCHNPTRVASWPHIARAALRRLASGTSAS
ncbi:GNAT family N-acetyltransferase [Caenibius tardaugens NBRC 16725]|nr:GNAT family N-acetyltransferase [Caenibius tardaugens NBRC 16725]